MKYIVLLRGINVGGKNKVSMQELKRCLEDLGHSSVITYINSGNVVLESSKDTAVVAGEIENILPKTFSLDSELIKILVLSHTELEQVAQAAPQGFGQQPDLYHSDVAFLINETAENALPQFTLHPDVDAVWPGPGVIYYRRLSAQLTKSRLSKITAKPVYKSMTIRTWNTVVKLLALSSPQDNQPK